MIGMKNLENPTGVGTVFQEGNQIAKVRYLLSVRQRVHERRTLSGVSQSDGLTSAEGVLSVPSGNKLPCDSGPLELQLADGRRMQFIVLNPDPISNKYSIASTGDWMKPDTQ